jgi:hypothetical protein
VGHCWRQEVAKRVGYQRRDTQTQQLGKTSVARVFAISALN